jgi:MSHA pilin protein MshA
MLRNEKGFTLIELIMVIVLLGILAAIAVPKYADLQNDAKDAVTNATIGAAKSTAVILFASKKGVTSTYAQIFASLEYDPAVGLSGTNCQNLSATYTGRTAIPFSISSSFCSP